MGSSPRDHAGDRPGGVRLETRRRERRSSLTHNQGARGHIVSKGWREKERLTKHNV